MGKIVRAARLYLADGHQQFRRFNLPNGASAENGEDIAAQPPVHVFGMMTHPGVTLFLVPLYGDRLERIGVGQPLPLVLCFALRGWVKPLLQLLVNRIALDSGILQSHFGVDAKRERLFLARLPVAHPPVFFPIGKYPEIEAVSIGQLANCGPAAYDILASRGSQQVGRHRGNSVGQKLATPNFYHGQKPDVMGRYRTTWDAIQC